MPRPYHLLSEIRSTRKALEEGIVSHLPFRVLFGNKILYRTGHAGFVLRITPIPFLTETEERLESLHDKIKICIDSLPLGTTLQCVFRKYPCVHEIVSAHCEENHSDSPLTSVMLEERSSFLRGKAKQGELFSTDVYLFIVKEYEDLKPEKPCIVRQRSLREIQEKNQSSWQRVKADLEKIERSFIAGLQGITDVFTPTEDEIVQYLAACLSPRKERDHTKRFNRYNHNGPLHIQIPESGFFIEKTHLEMPSNPNFHIGAVSLNLPPKTTPLTIINEITNKMDFPVRVSFSAKPLDRNKSVDSLKREEKRLRHSANSGDVEAKVHHGHVQLLLENMIQGGSNRMYATQLSVVTWALSQERLELQIDGICKAFEEMEGAQGLREMDAAFFVWLSNIPGNIPGYVSERSYEMTSDNVASMLPVLGNKQGSKRNIMLFHSKYKTLIPFDPMDPTLAARNAVIIGKTGSGKSFILNQILWNYWTKRPRCVVLDQGGSFRRLPSVFGGDLFEFREAGKTSINPFQNISLADEAYFVSIIASMTRDSLDSPIPQADRLVIEDAFYTLFGIGDTREKAQDLMQEEEDILRKDSCRTFSLSHVTDLFLNDPLPGIKGNPLLEERQRHLGAFLSRWTRGNRGRFFSQGESNISMDKNFTVYDLQGIESDKELQQILFMAASRHVWDVVFQGRAKGYETVIALDEAFKIIATEAGSDFTAEFYRVIRKYGGGIYMLTQNVRDLNYNEKIRDSVVTNTHLQYILQYEDKKALREVLTLNDGELDTIGKLQYEKGKFSDILIRTHGRGSFLARLAVTPWEYWLATTDADDENVWNKILEETEGNISAAIEKCCERYPRGVTYGKA